MTAYFIDRIYYLDRTDEVVHLTYMTSGMWILNALQCVDGQWAWDIHTFGNSFEQLYAQIRHLDPNLLLQEEWA